MNSASLVEILKSLPLFLEDEGDAIATLFTLGTSGEMKKNNQPFQNAFQIIVGILEGALFSPSFFNAVQTSTECY